jgi:hypothetical protein
MLYALVRPFRVSCFQFFMQSLLVVEGWLGTFTCCCFGVRLPVHIGSGSVLEVFARFQWCENEPGPVGARLGMPTGNSVAGRNSWSVLSLWHPQYFVKKRVKEKRKLLDIIAERKEEGSREGSFSNLDNAREAEPEFALTTCIVEEDPTIGDLPGMEAPQAMESPVRALTCFDYVPGCIVEEVPWSDEKTPGNEIARKRVRQWLIRERKRMWELPPAIARVTVCMAPFAVMNTWL